jgi:hypothetical protein
MGFLRFYFTCLGRVLQTLWFLICLASTLLTFAIPVIINRWTTIDSTSLNTFIWTMPFALLGICLLVVPWIEAFRLYRDKETELAVERSGHAEKTEALLKGNQDLSKQIAELDNVTAELRQRLTDPKRNEKITVLNELIEKGEAYSKWAMEHHDSPLYARLKDDLHKWHSDAENYMASTLPHELENCVDIFGWPGTANQSQMIQYLTRRIRSLKAIRERTLRGSSTQS